MADKEHTQEIVTQKTTSHQENWTPAETTVNNHHPWGRGQRIVAIVAIIAVLYLLLIVGGLWIAHSMTERNSGFGYNMMDTNRGRYVGRSGVGMNGDQTYNFSQSSSDGLTTTTTNMTYTQTQGVVTAVNSDTIVVAGGGKTQTIKTNSSTTYANNTKPVVNDTVSVVGTKDSNTLTATQIVVNN